VGRGLAEPESVVQVNLRPTGALSILDFDIENRPLSYLGTDFTTAEITAIAASFVGEKKVHVWLLGTDDPLAMLEGFRALYDRADCVTGHYIRKHDLPIINGAMLEAGLPPLAAKLSSDTKLDLLKRGGVSASQESLADMLDVEAPKEQMNQAKWRAANRLTPEGIKETRRRVVGDVRQHKEMRARLVELGWLGPPRTWSP
jgi:hypothetical protein